MRKAIVNIVIGLAIAALVLGFLQWRGCVNLKKGKDAVLNVKTQVNDSTTHYKDFANREHAQRMQVQAELAVADAFYGEIIDSLVKANKIKPKQLETFATVGTVSAGTVEAKVDTIHVDSGKAVRLRYADEWVKITGIASKGKATIDYWIKDSLAVTSYWKRKGFWGRKVTYIDAYSLNPKVSISGMQGVKITEERRKPFGISAYVGYGYNGTQFQPSIGLALTYDLIKF